jgi:hypothetical protein
MAFMDVFDAVDQNSLRRLVGLSLSSTGRRIH